MERMKKMFALVLVVMVVLSILLSVSFVSHGTSHDCAGEDCRICAVMHKCAQMLEELLAVASFAVFLGAVIFTVSVAFVACRLTSAFKNPVSLKVKLSN